MKTIVTKIILFSFAVIALVSCRSYGASAFGGATDIDPYTTITSVNEYDLIVEPNGVEYTIDISTPDGRIWLKNIKNEQEAKDLINAEAARKYNCAMLVRPKYTVLRDGKKILRLTVFGFPANYKNKEKDYDYVPMENRQKVDVNINH